MKDDTCKACGASQENRPMIFRGEFWCSDSCRKSVLGTDD